MANFTTHIGVGTVVSGALATLTLGANVIDHGSLVAVTLAGVVGSILPDIDLKDSRPSRALFSGLAIFFSFAVLFSSAQTYSLAELWILWLGTLVGVRYGVHAVFHRIAVHRGVWHSLLAAAFCALLTSIVFKYVLGTPDGIAWLGAAFMAVGYLTHLVLDEVYSVDVMDTRIKASFGTALKLFDVNQWRHSLAMAILTIGAAAVAPPYNTFVQGLSSDQMWAGLRDRLLPKHAWFGVIDIEQRSLVATNPVVPQAGTPATAATLPQPIQPTATGSPAPATTGSIAPRTNPFRTIATDEPGGVKP
ncbi:MAG: metal-dependent hydrolase [Hyphomicrobiaceae bacterium]|nr:metal-dependent hydrolase [Hyphomicrobiaceae bacterium]